MSVDEPAGLPEPADPVEPTDPVEPVLHVATLVADVAVNKLDALAVIAAATDGRVVGARTPEAAVALPSGARVEIDIPKFGEPPPLTLDVVSTRDAFDALEQALHLRDLLVSTTGWPIHFAGSDRPTR